MKGLFTTEEEAEDAALTGVYFDTWDTFVASFANLCLQTFVEEEFDQRWTEMKKRIAEECAEYMQNIWFDNDKDKFCAPWLTHVFNFGQLTPSRVEGAHAAFKTKWVPRKKSCSWSTSRPRMVRANNSTIAEKRARMICKQHNAPSSEL